MLAWKRIRVAVWAVVAAGLTLTPARWAWPVEPREAGLHQLVVIPPGAHERGLPAVRTESVDGINVQIDIPPTLHVHRYYYSGDQEFQGPLLQGGPTVVVANHPKTGERMYVDVTLPPGAPVIAYCKSSITYVYPDSRVAISFSSWHPDRVSVKYHTGEGTLRRTHEITEHMLATTKHACTSSTAWQSFKEFGAGGAKLLNGGRQALDSLAGGLLDRTKQLGAGLPGMSAVQSLADQTDERAQQAIVRGADAAKERADLRFLPTNR